MRDKLHNRIVLNHYMERIRLGVEQRGANALLACQSYIANKGKV